jgi:hypothetical protein
VTEPARVEQATLQIDAALAFAGGAWSWRWTPASCA